MQISSLPLLLNCHIMRDMTIHNIVIVKRKAWNYQTVSVASNGKRNGFRLILWGWTVLDLKWNWLINIDYIRAAILQATGVKLTLEQVKSYLVEEGLCTPSRADKVTFRGYGAYYGDVYAQPIPDLKEVLLEEGVTITEEDTDWCPYQLSWSPWQPSSRRS